MTYRHDIRVRYVDCDAQRVVYNAHYLTFVDDTLDCWLREMAIDFESLGFDVMVKTATVTWHEPVRMAETLCIEAEVTRWGNTSLDVSYTGHVDVRLVFEATVTYVVVDPDTYAPIEIPDQLRAHLSG